METKYELIKESNEVLRSCYSVIEREGKTTNWDALKTKVGEILKEQHEFLTYKPIKYCGCGIDERHRQLIHGKTICDRCNLPLREDTSTNNFCLMERCMKPRVHLYPYCIDHDEDNKKWLAYGNE
jgi:hypothetical protein